MNIEQINVFNLEIPQYNDKELNLMNYNIEDYKFDPSTDFIEAKIYDESKNLIYSDGDYSDEGIYRHFTVIENDIKLNVKDFITNIGYNTGVYFVLYNFYRKICSDNNKNIPEYFISEIDSSRTELRLSSIEGINDDTINSIHNFINFRDTSTNFIDFVISFGNDNFLANNILVEEIDGEPTLLIKLYEPLPNEFNINDSLLLLLEINSPQGYKVSLENVIEEVDLSIPLRGPNFNVDLVNYSNNTSEELTLHDIESLGLFNENIQLKSLLADSKNKLNIDYSKFNNFIHFSSAFKRLYNFVEKVKLIEYLTAVPINNGFPEGTTVDSILSSFDGYEYYLYYKSFPKDTNGDRYPLLNVSTDFNLEISNTTSPAPVWEWYSKLEEDSLLYDENNPDNLYWNIPEYLREDEQNYPYRLFIEMIGHQFDDIWVYIKNIENIYNGDNRVDFGISKDLLVKMLNNFGLKVYNGSYSTQDLYTAFLGTKTGTIPYANMKLGLPVFSGEELILEYNDVPEGEFPLNDIEYRIFKRLFHNLPYLYKAKGTINALKTLINIYGIPAEVLTIKEFGEKTKVNSTDSGVMGKVLIQSKSLQQAEYGETLDNKFNKYVEIGLSPQDQINNHMSSSGFVYNIDELIGDPTKFDKGDNQYIDLSKARDQYFETYINSYDLKDFVRLVKFINNSLFKMVRNFIPANTTISSGIIIKQHELERNKTSPNKLSLEEVSQETLIKSGVHNYKEYNKDYPTDDRKNGSTIHITSGGTGGSFEKYNGLHTNPTSEAFGNIYKMSQSWDENIITPEGSITRLRTSQREFYDGDFGTSIEYRNPEICRAYFSTDNMISDEYNFIVEPEISFPVSSVSLLRNNTYVGLEGSPTIQLFTDGSFPRYLVINNVGNKDEYKRAQTSEYVLLNLAGVRIYDPNAEGNAREIDEEAQYKIYYSTKILDGNRLVLLIDAERSPRILGSRLSSSSNYVVSTGNALWRASASGADPSPVLATGITSSKPHGYFPKTATYPKEQQLMVYNNGIYYNQGTTTSTSYVGTAGGDYGAYLTNPSPERDGDHYNTVYLSTNNANQSNIVPWFMSSSEAGNTYLMFDSSSFEPITTPPINIDNKIVFLGIEFVPMDINYYAGNLRVNTSFTTDNETAGESNKVTLLLEQRRYLGGIWGNSTYVNYTRGGGNSYTSDDDASLKNYQPQDYMKVTLTGPVNRKPKVTIMWKDDINSINNNHITTHEISSSGQQIILEYPINNEPFTSKYFVIEASSIDPPIPINDILSHVVYYVGSTATVNTGFLPMNSESGYVRNTGSSLITREGIEYNIFAKGNPLTTQAVQYSFGMPLELIIYATPSTPNITSVPTFQYNLEYSPSGLAGTWVPFKIMVSTNYTYGDGGGGCPTPDMNIMVSPTEYRAAGDLQIGDIVYTKPDYNETWGYYKVISNNKMIQPVYEYTFSDDSTVKVSESHKFLTDSGEYLRVDEFNEGTMIKTYNGLVSITDSKFVREQEVVKFEIDDAHTYVVNGLISHNYKEMTPE